MSSAGPYAVLVTGDTSERSYRFGAGRLAPIRLGQGSWYVPCNRHGRGVTVGRGASCGNSVATRDVPNSATVAGCAARVIPQIRNEVSAVNYDHLARSITRDFMGNLVLPDRSCLSRASALRCAISRTRVRVFDQLAVARCCCANGSGRSCTKRWGARAENCFGNDLTIVPLEFVKCTHPEARPTFFLSGRSTRA